MLHFFEVEAEPLHARKQQAEFLVEHEQRRFFATRDRGGNEDDRQKGFPGARGPENQRTRSGFDAAAEQFIAHVSSQSLHGNRDAIARVLNVPPERLRFMAPDVGGGFGAKNFPYPEQALIPWAAKRCGRPGKLRFPLRNE